MCKDSDVFSLAVLIGRGLDLFRTVTSVRFRDSPHCSVFRARCLSFIGAFDTVQRSLHGVFAFCVGLYGVFCFLRRLVSVSAIPVFAWLILSRVCSATVYAFFLSLNRIYAVLRRSFDGTCSISIVAWHIIDTSCVILRIDFSLLLLYNQGRRANAVIRLKTVRLCTLPLSVNYLRINFCLTGG